MYIIEGGNIWSDLCVWGSFGIMKNSYKNLCFSQDYDASQVWPVAISIFVCLYGIRSRVFSALTGWFPWPVNDQQTLSSPHPPPNWKAACIFLGCGRVVISFLRSVMIVIYSLNFLYWLYSMILWCHCACSKKALNSQLSYFYDYNLYISSYDWP